MGDLMFKELVNGRSIPVVSVLLASFVLTSCSSGVSRFQMPMFGLSKQHESTSALSPAPSRESQFGYNNSEPIRSSRDSVLSEFENNSDQGALAARSNDYNNRNSYLPPQTAAPEVRSARYGAGNSVVREPHNQYRRIESRPLRPIEKTRPSLLPAEPRGYNYNSRPAGAARSVRKPHMTKDGNSSITVGPGDTLYAISRRYNVPVVKLMEINQLSDSNLRVGQRIALPSDAVRSAPRKKPANQVVRATRSGTHTVRSGENFQSIARKYGLSATELADINGITDPGSLRPGEVLILPAGSKARKNKRVASRPKVTAKKKPSRSSDMKVRPVKTRVLMCFPRI